MDNLQIDINTYLNEFLKVYPEFKPLFIKDNENVANFETTFLKVICLYQEFNNPCKCDKFPLFALVAHYFVMGGFASSIGILSQKGLVSSSSVGDVSVSYQASPYSTKGNDFTYFLSLTPYGMEYLAYLQRKAGVVYVN